MGTPESAAAAAVGPLSGASRSLAPRWGPNHFFVSCPPAWSVSYPPRASAPEPWCATPGRAPAPRRRTPGRWRCSRAQLPPVDGPLPEGRAPAPGPRSAPTLALELPARPSSRPWTVRSRSRARRPPANSGPPRRAPGGVAGDRGPRNPGAGPRPWPRARVRRAGAGIKTRWPCSRAAAGGQLPK